MKVVFTICSNNYLAQAKSLGDSVTKYNPDYIFIIALVDEKSTEIDYSYFEPYLILPISEAKIDCLDEMCQRYDITELNTAVKPYLFNYLFETDGSINTIIYLDPDILVYEKFDVLESDFVNYDIILTPHFFKPIYDDFFLKESDILNAGLYNLGFLGLKKSKASNELLDWWMIKLKDQCLIDFSKGLFVDQLWMNFAPLYFEKVLILKHLGHNVAYWNLHERKIVDHEGKNTINNEFPLIFYHFSGFNFNAPENISKYQNRYVFNDRRDVIPLFENYYQLVMDNNFEKLSKIACSYVRQKVDPPTLRDKFNNRISIRSLKRFFVRKLHKVLD